jgi:hypothetical protein
MTSGTDTPTGSDTKLQFHHSDNSSWDKVFYVARDFINIPDSKKIGFGSSNDLEIYHNGTESYVNELNNHLILRTTTANKNIYIQSEGSILLGDVGANEYSAKFINDGAVELYHDNVLRAQTTAHGFQAFGNLTIRDDVIFYIGDGNDLQIKHDATNSYISNSTGQLYIESGSGGIDLIKGTYASGEWMLRAIADGAVEAYHNGNKKFWTRSDGIEVTGVGVFSNHLYLPDDVKLILGNEPDLEIYHTGSHGYIKNDTGKLFLQAKDGEHSVECEPDEGVKLYYNNVKKLETLSGGIAIDGWLRVGGTAQANEFDDYEEGNWTPTLPNSGSATFAAVTYAYYTKIGREVFWYLSVSYRASSHSEAIPDNSTTFQIGGLPFNASGYGTGDVTYNDGSDLSESNSISTLVWTGNDRIYFHFLTTDTNAAYNSWARSKWSNKTILYGGHYRI